MLFGEPAYTFGKFDVPTARVSSGLFCFSPLCRFMESLMAAESFHDKSPVVLFSVTGGLFLRQWDSGPSH